MMIPITVIRRLVKIRYKAKRSKLLQIGVAVVILSVVFAGLFAYFEGLDFFTALYWAVITMATIGYGDITPKTEAGRVVAMVAAVAGISTFTALVSLLAEFLISSSLRRMMGMHRVGYSGHYVVIGQGSSVVSFVNEILSAMDRGELPRRPVVVVFPNEEERRKVELPEEVEVLIGDPINRETLERARVESASHVVLALDDDSKSVFVTLRVKSISSAKVLVEALSGDSIDLLKQAGADRVVLSRGMAGRLLASAVIEPEVVDVIDDITSSLGGYDITVVELREVWGMKYSEALELVQKKYGLYLMGYYTDRPVLVPRLDSPVPEGSKLIVIRGVGTNNS
ncbi:potassium channel family protein [Thermococcus stetteri]|nr:voltage-gated potassium channel [Thermococcus stetteri]